MLESPREGERYVVAYIHPSTGEQRAVGGITASQVLSFEEADVLQKESQERDCAATSL